MSSRYIISEGEDYRDWIVSLVFTVQGYILRRVVSIIWVVISWSSGQQRLQLTTCSVR